VGEVARIEPAAQGYIDAIPAEQRTLFDRMHGLILEVQPAVEVVISYKMPTYVAGPRRLHVAAWKHGISLYGWAQDDDGGFTDRHPEMSSGKGTIRIPSQAADEVTDDELRAIARGALGGAG
jgi:uncharacterized protein YdhG (YjbR/CyaY superfamily)